MSLWNAKSVNPDAITEADIAEVCAELGIDTTAPVGDDFFHAGATYRRANSRFRCAVVGVRHGTFPRAVGYLPVNLSDGPTWEFAAMSDWDWRRGWTKVEA
ncbi:MAG: hypothetical protein HOY79_17605 [Streptomyces sp.]|nr:hypothetical protein [Streptomyces sp.]